jgi:hypothetical protein
VLGTFYYIAPQDLALTLRGLARFSDGWITGEARSILAGLEQTLVQGQAADGEPTVSAVGSSTGLTRREIASSDAVWRRRKL